MSSTNKTTYYELSQFLGTDKPAWLNDYNTDMGKIDAGVHSAQATATSADGKASTNASSIGTLANLTTTDKTSLVGAVNEVNTAVGTAQGTASDAYSLASGANTNITNLSNYFTMTQFTTPTATITAGCTISDQDLSCASNASGSLGKIYGRVYITSNMNGTATLTFQTPLRPTSAITINGGSYGEYGNVGDAPSNGFTVSYSIATDGVCTVTLNVNSNRNYRIFFWNSIIFATDFGDVPTPE